MDVTTDDVHDSEVLPRLLKDTSINRDVIKAFMDGAYIYNTLINMQTR
jgi:hypothetical protein